jgi:hypothetical protein
VSVFIQMALTTALFYILYSSTQMVEQLIARQQEMQQHHAVASLFCQMTMTQEYGKP